jgi:hypothetical protein
VERVSVASVLSHLSFPFRSQDCCLIGCDTVSSGRILLTFLKNLHLKDPAEILWHKVAPKRWQYSTRHYSTLKMKSAG